MTASAFSLSSLYPSESFERTSGDTVIGGLHGPSNHSFCPHCLSWVFSRPEGMEAFVMVRSTMFDDVESEPPFIETHTSEKLPWSTTQAVHSFEKFPPPEQFPKLLAAFAQRTR